MYCESQSLCAAGTVLSDNWGHISCIASKGELDVRGSVHHSILHKENPTRCNSVSKFYFIFIWSWTCFGRHSAHHQEPKTALASSGFAYVEGCWTCSCWTLTASSNYTSNNLPRIKTRGCYCSLRLPMMGGVSPETCSASYKYEIKFWCTVASCWIFYTNYTYKIPMKLSWTVDTNWRSID